MEVEPSTGTLKGTQRKALLDRLAEANRVFDWHFPGPSGDRRPVHVLYGGAHLFGADTPAKLGEGARAAWGAYAPDPEILAGALGWASGDLVRTVHGKVDAKLAAEPVEDFHIDFEDGYGNRPAGEEDAAAADTAGAVAEARRRGDLPPFVGIRIKPFTEEHKERGLRTLELFCDRLQEPPDRFRVTLPKVTVPEQVAVLASALDLIERARGWPAGAVRIEIMVETPGAVFGPAGDVPLLRMVEAGEGRVESAHFGTYDYTASHDIAAAWQRVDHPACDFAHQVMKTALAGTGVAVSDGATHVMPVGPHRGKELSAAWADENRRVVHAAWKLAADHIRHALRRGIYQGWDLHPAQLPVRFAATYAFFLESHPDMAVRLRRFVERDARATLTADVFDDAATGQGLLNFFLQGMSCGAISQREAEATGLTADEFAMRSFHAILKGRGLV